MEPVTILRENLGAMTSYGLLGVALLLIGFGGLEIVTQGSLRNKIWRDGHRGATVLSVTFLLGLAIAVAASIAVSTGLDQLWRGVLWTFIYGVVTIAMMMFSFVVIDALTPGPLGSILLDDEDGAGVPPAVWVSSVVFLAIGAFVAASLYL
ncbi:MAG: DUF350 domain-containing protein [Gordonia sp. (in: high G+C Gram-positive bacteria)]|uniref:DUF350 domain-containing protein n=1 Tax=Gordonia sp. (in: high G+C Gram-positive bacteria) TaxID=84139 RepID=UPI0039E2C874